MPAYVLICEEPECAQPLAESVMTIADRDALRCPACGGKLTNDYSRMKTTNFSLKGSGWPGKQIAMEGKIMRERNQD